MSEQTKDIDLMLLQDADPEARAVLERIQGQRERLYGRRLAREQALALRRDAGPDYALSHGSIMERVIGFGRQHPVVCVGAVGLGLLLGPRKLMRMATVVLPLVMKLRR